MVGSVVWKGGMAFEGQSGDFTVALDAKAPLGKGEGMSPKDLTLIGVVGCSAMDVVSLMRKYRQTLDSLEVLAKAEPTTDGHPVRFKNVKILFKATGQVEPEKLSEAVTLSQTKYCGVTAMIAATVPITYEIELNGTVIAEGEAKF